MVMGHASIVQYQSLLLLKGKGQEFGLKESHALNAFMETVQRIVKKMGHRTFSKPDIAEKSKGLAGIPAPGAGEDVVCPDCDCSEDASGLEFCGS